MEYSLPKIIMLKIALIKKSCENDISLLQTYSQMLRGMGRGPGIVLGQQPVAGRSMKTG